MLQVSIQAPPTASSVARPTPQCGRSRRRRGLISDGIVGPKTWAALGAGGGGRWTAHADIGGRGVSLHIGLNTVDPDHYGGWDGALSACEFDANDMRRHRRRRRVSQTEQLLTTAATRQACGRGRHRSRRRRPSVAGDTFLVTYSGHGGQVPDVNSDEADAQDETWVLYDRELLDDELYQLWAALSNRACGSPCCRTAVTAEPSLERCANAASSLRDAKGPGHARGGRAGRPTPPTRTSTTGSTVRSRKDVRGQVKATVVLISGCQDDQTSLDGDRNGAFTGALREVWSDGSFQGNWREFHQQIRGEAACDASSPTTRVKAQANDRFETARPFSL